MCTIAVVKDSAVRLLTTRLDTPVGEAMVVAGLNGRLQALHWSECRATLLAQLTRRHRTFVVEESRALGRITGALAAYFGGTLDAIDALDVDSGGTPFQLAVWRRLRRIRSGSTLSYAALAARMGRPTAVRAVGHANAANPISIVIPCHRLVGSDGALTGYGGGIDRKRWLLDHEARWSPS